MLVKQTNAIVAILLVSLIRRVTAKLQGGPGGQQSQSTRGTCQNIPDWHDSFGAPYDCDFYGAQGDKYCSNVGDLHGNMGLTANKACCTCGGGLEDSLPITLATGWQLFVHRDVYFWAVQAVELYSSVDCDADSRVSMENGAAFFDSGHKGNQGPDLPFRNGLRWPGRKDANENFYLGVEFDSPQTVRCIRLFQNGQGTPSVMILAKESSSSPWTNVHFATELTGGWNTIPLAGGHGGLNTATLPTVPTRPTQPSVTSPPNFQPSSNPIEVPTHLVPRVPGANRNSPDTFCRYLDLSSVVPPPNPGYPTESIGTDTVLTGDDIWETSFYMMLFANCERQVRHLAPFSMWSNDVMLELQPTYVFQSGHGGFGARVDIIRTLTAEGAGGGPVIGNEIPARRAAQEDTIVNRHWDPMESARVAVAGLVNHGDALRDPDKHCVWASVTLGPQDNDWMSAVLLYGRAGCTD